MELSEIVKTVTNDNTNGILGMRFLFSLIVDERLLEIYEGKTVLDYILEYKRNTKEFDEFAVYNAEIAKKYLEYGLTPNIDSEEIIMSKYDEEKTILEKYIEKYFDVSFLNIITNLIKDGRSLQEILSCKIDNKYIFEHLEEKGLKLTIAYRVVANDEKIILDLIEKGYDIIDYISADTLLKTINGEIFLDTIVGKLLQKGKIKFILNVENNAALLTRKLESLNNRTLIEYMTDTFPLEKLIRFITPEVLLYMVDENRTILDLMIIKNRDFVEEKLTLIPNILRNQAIASILKTNGFKVEMPIYFKGNAEDYLKELFLEECDKEIPKEAKSILNELYNLLMNDERNDKSLIELVVGSFRKQFANGFEYAYRDLKTIIELVKQGKIILKEAMQNSFCSNGIIYLRSQYSVSSFDHEMAHALHWFTSDNATPVYFEYDFSSMKYSQVQKIADFLREVSRKREKFKSEQTENSDLEYLMAEYYQDYENRVIADIQKAQNNIDIPSSYLMKVIMPKPEFLAYYCETYKRENFEKNFFGKFYVEMALENLFDALSYGNFLESGVTTYDGNIRFHSGHGREYFKRKHPFAEVLANYVAIIKSSRKEYGLTILRDIMGQEFIDKLDEFYANLYFKDLDYELEGESHSL